MFTFNLAKTAALSFTVLTTIASPIKRAVGSVQLVQAGNFADPSIIEENGTWYSFATNNGDGINVQISTSTNFKSWSLMHGRDAMPKVGAWVDPSSPSIWAPDVVKNDEGAFVLYYSGRVKGNGQFHCVGAATSKTIDGPYSAEAEPLACDVNKGGAIDASGFRDITGQRYVVYKVDGNSIGHGGLCGNTVAPIVPTPIMLQKVAGDGITLQGGPIQILDRDARDGPLVEAPSLMRTEDGKYVLFFSSSCYSTTLYDVSYAIADHIAGPYTKGGPLFVTGTAGLVAPGGASVAADGKHLVFHANHEGTRSMFATEISTGYKNLVVSY